MSKLNRLADDFQRSLEALPFAWSLALVDVKMQYRRTYFGPLWISLSTLIFIFTFSYIGAEVFSTPFDSYLAYFSVGLVFFNFTRDLVFDSCSIFISAEGYLRRQSIPKMIFVFRSILKQKIILIHNLLPLMLVLHFSGVSLSHVRFLDIAISFLFFVLIFICISPILGAISARFRDIPQILNSIVTVLFFLTPIIWRPSRISPDLQWIVNWNPFAAAVDLFRAPILNEALRPETIQLSAYVAVVAVPAFLFGFSTMRSRIVYWL